MLQDCLVKNEFVSAQFNHQAVIIKRLYGVKIMNIMLKGLSSVLMAAISASVYAHGGFTGTLGTSTTATDIRLFKCAMQTGIDRAQAAVWDTAGTSATPPNITIQTATAPVQADSATACNGATWSAAVTSPGEAGGGGGWSAFTADISVVSQGYYCIKITKDTASANSDDYQLDTHCGKPPSGGNPAYFGHKASTKGISGTPAGYNQDQ
jgi:hypothetical protein